MARSRSERELAAQRVAEAGWPSWARGYGDEFPWYRVAGVVYFATLRRGHGALCAVHLEHTLSPPVLYAETWQVMLELLAERHGVTVADIEISPRVKPWGRPTAEARRRAGVP